ncbi:MAG: hypothetical protein K0V04_23975 [Deltaproteobacteria bacterium]|nr:hypothetical protein [Deltaproteobacteria bacterium]
MSSQSIILAVISISLAAPLGCDAEPSSFDQRLEQAYTDDDRTLLPAADSQDLPEIASEHLAAPSAPTLRAHTGIETDDLEPDYCWVTLHYCEDPVSGGPTCSATKACTLGEVFEHCDSLIEQHC